MTSRIPFLDFRSYRRRLLDAELRRAADVFEGVVLDVGGGRERGTWSPPETDAWLTVDIERSFGPDIQGDARQLPIRSSSIDVVKCTEVLEHVPDPEAVVSELQRILKPGGALVLSTPFNYGIHGDPHDYQRFTKHKLERLLRDGFTIDRIRSQGAFWTVLAYMLQRAVVNMKNPHKRLLYPLLPILDQVTKLDAVRFAQASDYQQSFTTGYFVVAHRRDD